MDFPSSYANCVPLENEASRSLTSTLFYLQVHKQLEDFYVFWVNVGQTGKIFLFGIHFRTHILKTVVAKQTGLLRT
jgi:hypothetical protein